MFLVYDAIEGVILWKQNNYVSHITSGPTVMVLYSTAKSPNDENYKKYIRIYNSAIGLDISTKDDQNRGLQNVYLYEFRHGLYYILAENDRNDTCLYLYGKYWENATRLLCNLTVTDDHFPVLIHPYLQDVLYVNLYRHGGNYYTYISMDNGKTFSIMILDLNNVHKSDYASYMLLNFPRKLDSNGNHFPNPWSAIFECQYLDTHVGTVMSSDGGKTWKVLSASVLNYVTLNNGAILTRISSSSKVVEYSYDDGDSWRSVTLFQQKLLIENYVRVGIYEDEHLLVTATNGSFVILVSLSFSHMYSRICSDDDYTTWRMTQVINEIVKESDWAYLRIKDTSFCIDVQQNNKILATMY